MPACERQPGVVGDPSAGLVFARRDDAGSGDLFRARLSDGAVRRLWRTPERDESWPTWSQAAQRLAFQVGRGGREPADLWIWRPGEARPSPLAVTPRRDEGWPAWSPVAPRLAFAFRGGSRPPGVAIYDFAPGETPTLAVAVAPQHAWYLRPRFAPDGASLVAQRRAGRDSQLWILAPGSPHRALTHDPAWFHLKGAFTRDGRRVLFTRRPAAGGPADVASIDLGGGDLRIHASPADSDDQSGTPSPTRDEIALVSNRDGNYELYLAPLPDGPARRLTHTPDWDEGAPHWSPDGERIAITAAPRRGSGAEARGEGRLLGSRVRVLDRNGRQLFEAPGLMPGFMPPW